MVPWLNFFSIENYYVAIGVRQCFRTPGGFLAIKFFSLAGPVIAPCGLIYNQLNTVVETEFFDFSHG